MLVTENEATNKICPLKNKIEKSNCVGSYCMMWRWHTITHMKSGEKYGYCAVAGKPEL